MLEAVSRMPSPGTPRTFAKLAAYLEDDLFADELCLAARGGRTPTFL